MSRSKKFAEWLYETGRLQARPTNALIKEYRASLPKPAPRRPVDPDLPFCLIVDIDGTLAIMDGRGPFDTAEYETDLLDDVVAEVVASYRARGDQIIIVTGRNQDSYKACKRWFSKHKIDVDELYMRPADDPFTDDSEIKRKLYEEKIAPRFNVRFVLDDRDRVVDLWRSLGLKVFQVEDGDF